MLTAATLPLLLSILPAVTQMGWRAASKVVALARWVDTW